MAYAPDGLAMALDLLGGKFRVWVYMSPDPWATVAAANYITNAKAAGMKTGDYLLHTETDQAPPILTQAYVSALNATTGFASLTIMP
jgi:hypothetical protein